MTTELSSLSGSGNLPTFPGNVPFSPPAAPSGGPRVNPLMRYLSAVRRYKWLILLVTVVGLGAGYLTTRFKLESYTVRAQIAIADEKPTGPFEGQPIYVGDALKELFLSYPVITPVAESRRLFIRGPKKVGGRPLPLGPTGPDADIFETFTWVPNALTGSFALKFSTDGKTWELSQPRTGKRDNGAVGDSIGRAFGFEWNPRVQPRWYGKTFEFDLGTPREAADEIIQKRLKVTMLFRAARFMQISLDGENGVETAATLNDILERFVSLEGTTKRKTLNEQVANLDSQLVQAKVKLNEAESALMTYQVSTVTMPRGDTYLPVAPGLQQTSPGGQAAWIQRRSALRSLEQDRKALIDALASAKRNGSPDIDIFLAIPTVQQRQELKQVLLNYSQIQNQVRAALMLYLPTCGACSIDMPRLIGSRDHVRDIEIPAAAQIVLSQLDSDIAAATSDVATGREELLKIPTRAIYEERLLRDRQTQAEIVNALEKSYQSKRLEQGNVVNDVSIWSKAVAPLSPTNNKKVMLIAIGLLGGLALGLVITFLLDVTDKRVRWADQVTGGLGLTILGVIPEIKRAKGEVPSAEEAAQVIEAFRSIRLNLAHAMGDGASSFTISSPSPGDGKSLVASNLALSFAQAGYRTLLIDGDARRGEMHRTFGVERRPGLIDFLAGELPMADLLRQTSHPQLQLITSGSRKRNAPELLGSPRMRELMSTMRNQYEIVIVDSPPLGAGIDPFVLATVTGHLMLVLRAGATERDLAEAKLQIVDQLPIRLIGAVLNDVRATMNDYKYYSYSVGYGASQEGPETNQLAPSTGES